MTKTMADTKAVDEAFYDGVICALAVVQAFGQDVLFDEIVGTVSKDELVRIARKRGAMRWSGLSEWRKRQISNGEFAA